MNPIQFNALAIVFILVGMPFAIAFITNAGSSSEGEYEDSISFPRSPFPYSFPYWIDNGGTNYSGIYEAATPGQPNTAMTYVEDGLCPGNASIAFPCYTFNPGGTLQGSTAFESLYVPMTHYHDPASSYVGSSGDGPFTWSLNSWFFYEIGNDSIDKLKFSFIDLNVDHNCGSSIFENLTFDGEIAFVLNGKTKTYSNFNFETSNKYEHTTRDIHGFKTVCQVGFDVVFDFTGFETLEINEHIQGDWFNATIELKLNHFKTDSKPITTTALPFAGVDQFALGVQHQPVNPVEAGFIIKTGTIVLSVATFVLAIASTPYWDPFRNLMKGAID